MGSECITGRPFPASPAAKEPGRGVHGRERVYTLFFQFSLPCTKEMEGCGMLKDLEQRENTAYALLPCFPNRPGQSSDGHPRCRQHCLVFSGFRSGANKAYPISPIPPKPFPFISHQPPPSTLPLHVPSPPSLTPSMHPLLSPILMQLFPA